MGLHLTFFFLFHCFGIRPKKKDCCVQVSEVKKIRVGRSKNIFILEFFFYYTCTEVAIEDWVLEVSFVN